MSLKKYDSVLLKSVLVAFVFSLATSCVSNKKFLEQEGIATQYRLDLEDCKDKNDALMTTNEDLEKRLAGEKRKLELLQDENEKLQLELKTANASYDDLNKLYSKLAEQNKELLNMSTREKEILSSELLSKEQDLKKREEELKRLEQLAKEKEEALNLAQNELKTKEQRLQELEALLKEKDDKLAALKQKIQKALIDFSPEDITIENIDGKLYVRLSENLLFSSGSFNLETQGTNALVKLSGALKDQTEFLINVEGHTDNVPYNSSSGPIRNNLDLSVLRATTVANILIEKGNLPSTQIVASGRGPSIPVASNDTKEGRSANRRTEIILTPDINSLLELIEE